MEPGTKERLEALMLFKEPRPGAVISYLFVQQVIIRDSFLEGFHAHVFSFFGFISFFEFNELLVIKHNLLLLLFSKPFVL